MAFPRVTARRISHVAVVMAVTIGLLPIGPSASALTTGALTLNGTNQYVTMGASPGLRSSAFTLELWFRRTGAGVGQGTGTNGIASAIPLITKGRAEAETADADINYFFGIDATTGVLVADFEEAQTGAQPSMNHPIVGNTVVTSNVWHHAAATYDGTSWNLYLDGSLDKTLAVGRPANIATTAATVIGSTLPSAAATQTPLGFFQGQVDEARIWNNARSLSQLQAGMGSEIGATPGLSGVWHMNEGTGTVVNDSSGSAINGTAINAPSWTTGTTFTNAASNALSLNGTNQYVTMGASPGLRSSTFTVELWFRRTAAGLGTSTGNGGVTAVPLITKGRAEGETAAQDVNYFFGIDTATGKLAADFEEAQTGASPSLNHPIIGNTVVTSNVWHQAAATYDGTTWRLYLDGAQDGSLVVGQPANAAVTSATAIGSALTSDGRGRRLLRGPDRRGAYLEHRALAERDPGEHEHGDRTHERPLGPVAPERHLGHDGRGRRRERHAEQRNGHADSDVVAGDRGAVPHHRRCAVQRNEPIRDDGRVPGSPLLHLHG